MAEQIRIIFGNNLRKYRMLEGITQAALARALKCPATSVCGWERGDYLPTSAKIHAIADILHINATDLMSDGESRPTIGAALDVVGEEFGLEIRRSDASHRRGSRKKRRTGGAR